MITADGQTGSGSKSAADRPPVLELTGVTKSFGPLVAVARYTRRADFLALTLAGPRFDA